jgi:hypothetical protein
MLDRLVKNQQLVQHLWDAVNTTSGNIGHVAPLIKRVLETGAWKERKLEQRGGKVQRFDRFVDFIKTAPLEGCGWNPDDVEALIHDDADVLARWRKAITPPKHIHHDDSSNRTIRGTTRAYTLDRLERERPDLFERVKAKELSANAAAIEAGFRKKPVRRCPNCGHEW